MRKKVGVGEAIRRERAERGWSQWELAKRSGIMPSEISKYENGRYEPNLTNYFKLCEAFGWPASPPKREALHDSD